MHANPIDICTSDDALARLKAGNARFLAGHARFPTVQKDILADLAKGQHPFATILGCSDSRVPPELVFDASFGELFVIRVAGNVIDPAVAGTLQYAALHLRTPLLVILGHEGCGAVDAAIAEKFRGVRHPGRIAVLVDDMNPRSTAWTRHCLRMRCSTRRSKRTCGGRCGRSSNRRSGRRVPTTSTGRRSAPFTNSRRGACGSWINGVERSSFPHTSCLRREAEPRHLRVRETCHAWSTLACSPGRRLVVLRGHRECAGARHQLQRQRTRQFARRRAIRA